jgi:hypothetical protein
MTKKNDRKSVVKRTKISKPIVNNTETQEVNSQLRLVYNKKNKSFKKYGIVLSIKDGIASIGHLDSVKSGEMVDILGSK